MDLESGRGREKPRRRNTLEDPTPLLSLSLLQYIVIIILILRAKGEAFCPRPPQSTPLFERLKNFLYGSQYFIFLLYLCVFILNSNIAYVYISLFLSLEACLFVCLFICQPGKGGVLTMYFRPHPPMRHASE